MANFRHQARIAALQVLFEADVTDHLVSTILDYRLQHHDEAAGGDAPLDVADEAVPPDVAKFCRVLVNGAWEQREQLDRLIEQAAPHWPLYQMPPVDKAILRLAIWELRFHAQPAPPKAVINEAVELAKHFGGDQSGRFVNGVLGAVLPAKPAK